MELAPTIFTILKVNHISNADVDHTQETLILLLEFLLVKHLNRKYAILGRVPVSTRVSMSHGTGGHKNPTGQKTRSSKGLGFA